MQENANKHKITAADGEIAENYKGEERKNGSQVNEFEKNETL